MRLLNAHIINFGKLKDVDIDFSDGLNSFMHENGWGKTTLSVFIKSIFYGMEHSSVRDLGKNELKKYSPWQGGIYGGSLSFEIGGKKYLASRTFGQTKGKDSFELRDLTSGKPSGDYSERLGQEIFGISRESYARSVHVSLDESPAGSSDDISAKLNNLLEAADVSSYDKAIEALDKKASSLIGKKKNFGRVHAIQEEIQKKRQELLDIENRISVNEERQAEIAEAEKELLALEAERKEIEEALSLCAKYESKLRYEQLKNDVEDAKKTREELLDFFNGTIPSQEAVLAVDDAARECGALEESIKSNFVSQSERDDYDELKKYFSGDLPQKGAIDACLKADGEYNAFKREESEMRLGKEEAAEYEALKEKFFEKEISEEKINALLLSLDEIQKGREEAAQSEADLKAKKFFLEQERSKKNKNVRRVACFSACAALLIAAGVLFFLRLPIYFCAPLCALGLAFLALGIASKAKKRDCSDLEKEISELEQALLCARDGILKKEGAVQDFVRQFAPQEESGISALNKIGIEFDRYKKLAEKCSAFEEWKKTRGPRADEARAALAAFVQRYCKTDDISSVPALMQALNERLLRLFALENKINADAQNRAALEEKQKRLLQMLHEFKTEKSLSFLSQAQQIHDKLNDIKNCDELLKANIQKKDEFESDSANDIALFETLQRPQKSADEFRQELSSASFKITEKKSRVAACKNIIEQNLPFTEKRADVENDIERLSAEKMQSAAEHGILQKAMKFLSAAKERLDQNYSAPMKAAFEKYVQMLGGDLKLLIDTDLNVSVSQDGIFHESVFLSEGWKDLANFCARMALVDSLFKDEQPPIILDDPFVNLDDQKTARAVGLVKKMAQERQVLYFACHKSREA